MPGEHNRKNAGCAAAAAKCLGISDEIIKNILKTFSGLPGRLEFLGEKNGIAFYNDSNSTTPEAAIAALRTLARNRRPIVLIAGGSDKELDFTDVRPRDRENRKKASSSFKGKATEKLQGVSAERISGRASLRTWTKPFAAALAAAKPGDIILLSPGATSFGIFKNEYDRGDQFTRRRRIALKK